MPRDPLTPAAHPNPSRKDSREIVEAIITATIELASPHVTTTAIAKRAGVGIASLYRYFPNRGAIFAEISRRLLQKFLHQLNAIIDKPDLELAEFIREICKIAVDGPGVSNQLRQALNVMVPFSWSKDNADQAYRRAIELITSWFQSRVAAPPSDLFERVFVAFSAIRGVISMSMIYPDLAPDNEKLKAILAEAILGFLRNMLETPSISLPSHANHRVLR